MEYHFLKPEDVPKYRVTFQGWIQCTNCGGLLRDNYEENVVYCHHPYPQDEGFGQCRDCGGTMKAHDEPITPSQLEEEEYREKLGWAACSFYDSRVEIVAKALSEENSVKFMEMPFWRQVQIIGGMVQDGLII